MTYQDALQLPLRSTVRCADGRVGTVLVFHRRQEAVGIEIPGRWTLRNVPVARLELAEDGTCIERPA